jgi:S1-C subfamily serine protease
MRAFWFLILVDCSTQPGRGQSLAYAFDRVHSSVVTICVTEIEMVPRSPGQVVTTRGLGAGVRISSGGKILTVAHVGQPDATINQGRSGGALSRAGRLVELEGILDG